MPVKQGRRRRKNKSSAALAAVRSLGRALPHEAQTQAVFHGNANTPVTEVSHEQLFEGLHRARMGRGPLARDAKRLIRQLEGGEPWQMTAGIHSGGLGNPEAGVHPDQRPHISMSSAGTGFHLRMTRQGTGRKKNKPQRIMQITARGDESFGGLRGRGAYGRTDAQRPSQVQELMDNEGLSEKEALNTVSRLNRLTKTDDKITSAAAARIARGLRGQKKNTGINRDAYAGSSHEEREADREFVRERQWGKKKKR